MMKKFIIVTITCLLVVLKIFSQVSSAAEGKIVIAQPGDVTTMDAHVQSDMMSGNVLPNIFDLLVERGPDMKLYPLLAESYKVLDDLTWQFKLRRGIKFTNGEPFNAAVVKWNIERMLDPATKAKNIARVSMIDRIDIVDDYTVNLVTKKPYPILDSQLSRAPHMLPPGYVREKGAAYVSTHPVGTGPYKFVKWIKDDYLELEANENYWRGVPKIKTVVIRPIPETSTRVNALINGEVDIIANVPAHLEKSVQKRGDAEVRKVRSLEVMYISLYSAQYPTNNKKVRQAINYGVNVDAIIKNVMQGNGDRRAGILSMEAFGFDPTVKLYQYNPEKAKRLLKEAQYDKDFDFVINLPIGRYLNEKAIGEAVAGELRKIGIKAKVKLWEWGSYVGNMTKHQLYPAHLQGWGPLTLDADEMYSSNLYSTSVFSHFQDERLDGLIEEGRSTIDKERRRKIYSEIAKLAREKATHLFLWQSINTYGVNKRVNWTPRPDEYLKMYDASLK